MFKKENSFIELSNWNSPLWVSAYLLGYCFFLGSILLELSTGSLNYDLKTLIILMEWVLIGFTLFNMYFIYYRKLHFHCSFISQGVKQVEETDNKFLFLDLVSLFPFFTFFIGYQGPVATGLKLFFALIHLSQFRFFKNIAFEYHFLAKKFKALIFFNPYFLQRS